MRRARDARTEVFSRDHVHPGPEGHLLMAQPILGGFGIEVPDVATAVDRLIALAGRLLREGVLQQNALIENDAHCAAAKTAALLDEPTEGIQPSIIKDIERVIRRLAAEGRLDATGVFHGAGVIALLDADARGEIDAAYPLMGVLCVESWLRQFVAR